jgi:hypothetical protein
LDLEAPGVSVLSLLKIGTLDFGIVLVIEHFAILRRDGRRDAPPPGVTDARPSLRRACFTGKGITTIY